jgi:hypothetical protein
MRISYGDWKFLWITSELSCLKNKKTKAAKRSRASEMYVLYVCSFKVLSILLKLAVGHNSVDNREINKSSISIFRQILKEE